MNDKLRFVTFCIEQYRNAHQISGKETVRKFKQYGVIEYLDTFFEPTHAMGAQYIVKDIDEFIAARS